MRLYYKKKTNVGEKEWKIVEKIYSQCERNSPICDWKVTKLLRQKRKKLRGEGCLIKENRCRQGWELAFGEEHRYVIAEEIGRGGSCIVYNGFSRDRIGERHLVKIKECYPYRLEIERCRGRNLTPDLSCKQMFLCRKQKFLEAYRKKYGIENNARTCELHCKCNKYL